MKRALRIIVPLLLILVVLASAVWYFLVYDRALTKEILLRSARYFEHSGNRELSTMLYDLAYSQSSQEDDVAIELAQMYLDIGNYTKAEYTLSQAIAANPSLDLYIALSNVYLMQDKLLDAVSLLDAVADPNIRQQLQDLRPAAPVMTPEPGFYTQYITVTAASESGTLYVSTDAEYPSVATDAYTGPITLDQGETVLYALTVGDNGLVSPILVYGYTIGGVVEQVEFQDPVIEETVRNLLSLTPREVIFSNQLWTIKEFTVPATVTSFEDLKYMTHLTHLTVEKGATGDLSVLTELSALEYLSLADYRLDGDDILTIGKLTGLKHLSLPDASLSTIAPLEGLTQLEYLDISGNTIRNIAVLGNMPNLRELHLNNNAINDLTVLSKLTALEILDVSYNSIQTLAPVQNLFATMTELYASHNQISSIQPVINLRRLNNLDLSYNKLTEVPNIGVLVELKALNLSNNEIADISGVESMLQLQNLKLAHNQITELPPFQKTCQLVYIDISHNQITLLDPLAELPMLNTVNVDYNAELESVEPLDSCPLLVRVNAYGTLVTEVTFLTEKGVIVNFDPTLALEQKDKDKKKDN